MDSRFDRRSFLVASGSLVAAGVLPAAHAQGKTKLRFSCAFTEQDPRADAYKAFAASIKDNFDFEPYWNNTLFKQGTELVALQRGNLEVCNLEFIKMARDQLEVQVVTPVYFGSRHVNLKPDKTIRTPADLAGIKLRMPPGEFWQFLGESIGASPTPVAFAEVYTALQSGAIDGQDNPLVTSKLMKFYEVTTQFVLTGHVVGYDVLAVSKKAWDAMPPAQQTQFQAAAEKAMDDYTAKYIGLEKDIVEFMKSQGKKVYAPDVNAFRAYAQKKYVDKYAQDWPKGALERINAL